MKLIGTVFTTLVVFLIVTWLWAGIPESLVGQELLYQFVSALTYSLVVAITNFIVLLVLVALGGIIGAMFNEGTIGMGCAVLVFIPVALVLQSLLLWLLALLIPWFVSFTFWQIVLVVVLQFVIGLLFGNYNVKQKES